MIYVDVRMPRRDKRGWTNESITIRNDGLGNEATGHYDVSQSQEGQEVAYVHINDFDRSRGAYALIVEAIKALGLEVGK